ncbi:MAG: leucyl/phenylalanyl-tRNA--protein transferase [Fimbriiglobus sp.]
MSEPLDKPWLPPCDANRDGLVGVGGDLSPETLLMAYRDGVFAWFNEGDPLLWWSPDPRAVFDIGGVHCSRSLARTIRSGKFRTTVNRCFEAVMRACGETRPEGTWVTNTMVRAFVQLHHMGYAHSLETWITGDDGQDQLVGGIYGLSIGGLFAGESMFHLVPDASKIALVALGERLKERGYLLFDTQIINNHTESMGAYEIDREEYLERLRVATQHPPIRFAD